MEKQAWLNFYFGQVPHINSKTEKLADRGDLVGRNHLPKQVGCKTVLFPLAGVLKRSFE
jgi:hypothetical protein